MDDYNVLVSIIIPVYGTEQYLPYCIESVCKQTYSNIQIILVDDKSPDACPEICDCYARKDSRILVIHQENKGVSGARNTGINHAVGEYIMFVDSDDKLYPNAIEILLKDARNYEADIVSASMNSNHISIDTEHLPKEEYSIYYDTTPLLLSLKGDFNTVSACAKLFKSSFINGIYFEEGKNINEDGFFIFQCYLKKPKLVQHDVSVYQYVVRKNSNSRQFFSEKYLSMLHFCECKKELIEKNFPQYIEQMYNMEVRTHLQFLQVLCRTNDKKFQKLYKDSVKTVRRLYRYHHPINKHHKILIWIVILGLYPLYKLAIHLKYYR